MTNEEAIKTVTLLRHCLEDYEDFPLYINDSDLTALDMAISALKESRPKGEWILDESDNSVTCNKCGCGMYLNDILNGEGHFCPNCGARMKGGK